MRAYAARHLDQVAGMVLVESSHEGQRPVLAARYTPKDRLFVALTVPQMIVRSRQWRGGADRRSNIREYRMFKRLGASDQVLARGGLGDRPLIVLTRGPGCKTRTDRLWQAWYGLQQDLAQLSANTRHVVSDSPDHYLNHDDPGLVITAITDVLRSARTRRPLGDRVASSKGE
jgi:pimeloyl-ACP methyl ester carboxylesterase